MHLFIYYKTSININSVESLFRILYFTVFAIFSIDYMCITKYNRIKQEPGRIHFDFYPRTCEYIRVKNILLQSAVVSSHFYL